MLACCVQAGGTAERAGMTARRILRRCCWRRCSACCWLRRRWLPIGFDKAIEKLKTAVANGDDSFVTVSFLLSESYNKLYRRHAERIFWITGSLGRRLAALPIIGYGVAGEDNSAITVWLRYAENHGEYKDALDAAVAACVRSSMTDVEKAASIYSWLADMIVPRSSVTRRMRRW